MKKNGLACFQAVICLLLVLQCHAAYGVQPTEDLPPAKFALPAPESAQVQKYLGLKAMGPFSVSDIKAKLVVIEFLSALCPQCHVNAPVVNRLYKMMREDAGLADVKLIGIAVGTEKPQLDAYKKNFKVPFPIFLDENFAISASMDGVATPTTMIVSAKDGKVLASHVGVIKDFDGFLKELRALHKKQ
ncbi:MAG: TlpA disulfide reductase family protein [Syntrophobacteraceae bacterium]